MKMKKLTTLIALMISLMSFAQKTKEQNVPQNITGTFHKKYPKAENVVWNKEGKNFEASFKVNAVDNSILLNADGKIIETEVAIKTNELPEKAIQYLKNNFKNKKIKEAAKIVTENGNVTYEAEIGNNDLLFDHDGNFIKKMKES